MEVAASTFREGGGRTPQQQAVLIEDLREVLDVTFEEDKHYMYGVTDSAKQVFFGRYGDSLVAVKPYQEFMIRHRAQHEADMMAAVQERGFRTFANPRVYVGSQATYLVTDYMPDLKPMNNVGWEAADQKQVYADDLAPLLQRIGSFVGTMHGKGSDDKDGHSKGIAHNDLGLKNVARLKTGAFILIDLEKAQLCDEMNETERQMAYEADLRSLINSLVRKNFMNSSDWTTVERELLINLIEPYLNSLESHGAPGEIGLKAAIGALNVAQMTHNYLHNK